MHIDFLLEEYSAEVALKNILPKLLSENVSYGLHSYEGKYDMLKKLADRLSGYSRWLPPYYKVMVLIDEDRKDCHEIKAQLEGIAQKAGLITKTNAINNECFQVVNRIAIEELEAWFFGDIDAINKAYPKIPTNLQTKKEFQNPDAIAGGTFETLEKLLKQKKYYDKDERIRKPEVAQNIAQHMDPNRNRSKSFNVFVEGIKACVGVENLKLN